MSKFEYICGTVFFIGIILCGGFLDGGNYIAAGVCTGVVILSGMGIRSEERK